MLDSFSRTEIIIGKEALLKLSKSKVSVFGIGGVGSFVVEGLARAGIGKFILVDHDNISITNINRQIHATYKSIGEPKVELMKKRILEINPSAQVTIFQKFFDSQSSEELLDIKSDYVVDAIDTISSKIFLIVSANNKGIPIISSMGAGNKLDATKFEVADIYNTSIDPLAKVMRRELKKEGIQSLKVVYSKEKPSKCLFSEGKQIIGSVPWVPSVAGLIIAGEVVKDIICTDN